MMAVAEVRPALFEGFNAKRLTPVEIANGFVVPPHFSQLIGTDHVAIVGPRGSGKTHLLRMLQGETLQHWTRPEASRYIERIEFSGVFIPADRLWMDQLEQLGSETSDRLFSAAFTVHAMKQLVEVMAYRTGESGADALHPAPLDSQQIATIVRSCAEAWNLEVQGLSFLALSIALDARLGRLSEVIGRLREGQNVDLPDYAYGDFLQPLASGISAFNWVAGERDHRWALLVDELELAPPAVHNQLIGALRAGSPNLLLKVSFSPFDRQIELSQNLRTATPDQDFRVIPLWYGRRNDAEGFSRALFRRLVSEAGLDVQDPAAVLGRSRFDTARTDWLEQGTSYVRGSTQQQLIQAHSREDVGLADYLARNEIDPRDLESVLPNRRASILRKIYPLLVFREALLFVNTGEKPRNVHRRRPRSKPVEALSGSGAVFAALEGNPRWLRAVLSELLEEYQEKGLVSPGVQFDVLRRTLERFRALLHVLPPTYTEDPESLFSAADYRTPSRTVVRVVEDIAFYFSRHALREFRPDPPGSFIIDDRADPQAIAALRTALNAGAIVFVGKHTDIGPLESLIGKRFRLAYLMAFDSRRPFPIRLGRSVDLSTILQSSSQRGDKRHAPPR